MRASPASIDLSVDMPIGVARCGACPARDRTRRTAEDPGLLLGGGVGNRVVIGRDCSSHNVPSPVVGPLDVLLRRRLLVSQPLTPTLAKLVEPDRGEAAIRGSRFAPSST